MKKHTRIILSIGLSFLVLTSCNNSNNNKTEEASDESADYNFDKHGEIAVFIDDLAKAVNNDDKNTIAQMTQFPLQDEWEGNLEDQSTSLSCQTDKQFSEKYDKIFTPGLKKPIKAKEYRGWFNNGTGVDVIEKGEFLIDGDGNIDGESERPRNMLGIKKIDGVFKIYAIKFYS